MQEVLGEHPRTDTPGWRRNSGAGKWSSTRNASTGYSTSSTWPWGVGFASREAYLVPQAQSPAGDRSVGWGTGRPAGLPLWAPTPNEPPAGAGARALWALEPTLRVMYSDFTLLPYREVWFLPILGQPQAIVLIPRGWFWPRGCFLFPQRRQPRRCERRPRPFSRGGWESTPGHRPPRPGASFFSHEWVG